MKTNVGQADRAFRLIAGAAIIVWGIYAQSWWGIIGVVPIATGLVKVCPLYLPFGLSTQKKDEGK